MYEAYWLVRLQTATPSGKPIGPPMVEHNFVYLYWDTIGLKRLLCIAREKWLFNLFHSEKQAIFDALHDCRRD